MTMWHIRAAQAADLPELEQLLAPATLAGLPSDGSGELLLLAEQLPADPSSPPGPRLGACLRLRSRIGMDSPRPWYHVGCVVHASRHLQLFHRQTILLLGNDHTGAAELADWGWDRSLLKVSEQAAVLQMLLRTALLLLAREHWQPGGVLIVELPGLRDAQGQSPFWQGLGRHFYAGPVQQAAQRHGEHWRTLVASLLPRQPVYTSFLPEATQQAIAQIDPRAGMLADLLTAEGLSYDQHITIDDGGPVFSARTAQLPTLLRARSHVLGEAQAGVPLQAWLVLSEQGLNAGLLRAHLDGQTLCLAGARPAWLGEGAVRAWAAPQSESWG
jgi:arginine N-succinyltransferase